MAVLEAGPGWPTGAERAEMDSPNYLRAATVPGRTWDELRVRRTPRAPAVPYLQGRGVGGGAAVNGGLWEVPSASDRARLAPLEVPPVPADLGVVVAPERWSPLDRALMTAAPALGASATGPVRLGRTMDGRALPGEGVPVRSGALVDRVLLEGRRAAGVRLAGGEELEADVVVVAAGALATPAILLRGGVEVDGLGAGLRDHSAVAVSLALRPTARAPTADAAPTGAVVRTGDIQLVPLALTGTDAAGLATGAVLGVHLGAHGTGSVQLRSPDPAVAAEVTFDPLGDERDRRGLRAVVRVLGRLARSQELTDIAEPGGVSLGADATPVELADAGDDDLDRWLAGHLADVYHPAGTTAAGQVTTAEGRLVGYEGVVVVDASVLPTLPRAAPQLTVAAVAGALAGRMVAAAERTVQ